MFTSKKNKQKNIKTFSIILFRRYNIMLKCWEADPKMRPLFHELESYFSKLLKNEDVEQFTRLNEPYVESNKCDFASRGIDYLTQVASPCYVSLPDSSQNKQNISEIPQIIQPNEPTVNQSINITTSTSKAVDLPSQSPSIVTSYLSYNEILKIQKQSSEKSPEEIELREQKTVPHSSYIRVSEITSSKWNITDEQQTFTENYVNIPKIGV